MLSPCTKIELFKCAKCAAPYQSERIEAGDGCGKCHSRQVQLAPPTFRYVSAWLLAHPSSIPRYVKENLLRWA